MSKDLASNWAYYLEWKEVILNVVSKLAEVKIPDSFKGKQNE